MQAVIGTENGESFRMALDEQQAQTLAGHSIGDDVDGGVFGLDGYTLEIRGGSDEDGFPMRRALQGTGRRKLLVGDDVGRQSLRDGERRRKSFRGNTVSGDIAQVNLAVTKAGDTPVEELLSSEDEGE